MTESMFQMPAYRAAWRSQFDNVAVPSAGPAACFRAARVICINLGAAPESVPEGTVRRFQCASGPGTVNPDETKVASDYLMLMCKQGRGVIVGVDYKPGLSQNRDGITDHFVTLCDYDEASGELRGLNPGAVVPPDMAFNCAFRWAPTVGAWVRSWPAHLEDTRISMVVPDTTRGASLVERP